LWDEPELDTLESNDSDDGGVDTPPEKETGVVDTVGTAGTGELVKEEFGDDNVDGKKDGWIGKTVRGWFQAA
jgi:hypothetical protein